jgi:DNA-binding transcriptional LysR family regulator
LPSAAVLRPGFRERHVRNRKIRLRWRRHLPAFAGRERQQAQTHDEPTSLMHGKFLAIDRSGLQAIVAWLRSRKERSAWPGENAINTLLNIQAFVRTARLGSFSAAARELGVAPSVITKRLTQLEKALGAQLVIRSTRGLSLTSAGERLLPRFVHLNAELDEIFVGAAPASQTKLIEGQLRIKAPTTLASVRLGAIFGDFLALHPGVTLEVALVDRSVNPLEEGFDFSIGALPVTYPNVTDVPLCPYDLVTCSAPRYFNGRPMPAQPSELVGYECLTSVLFHASWPFDTPSGHVTVDVHSRMHSSDSRMLREATLKGLGIAVLPRFLVEQDLRDGALVEVLENFPIVAFWVKALVPRIRMKKPAVREMLSFLKARMQVPLEPPRQAANT